MKPLARTVFLSSTRGARSPWNLILLTSLLCGFLDPSSLAQPQSPPGAKKEHGTPDQHEIHQVLLRDGAPTMAPVPLFKKASSPDAIKLRRPAGSLQAGTTLLYFVDFSEWNGQPRTEFLALSASTNGRTFGPRTRVQISPESIGRQATDPSVVQLRDGRLRLYFMTPGTERGQVIIRSASGTDGVHFAIEPEMALAAPGNPEVAQTADGWVMFLSDYRKDRTLIHRSSDGLHWETTPQGSVEGTGAGILETTKSESVLRVFLHARGIRAFTWSGAQGLQPDSRSLRDAFGIPGWIGADPSPIEEANGDIALYYKAQELGAPPQGRGPFQDPTRPH